MRVIGRCDVGIHTRWHFITAEQTHCFKNLVNSVSFSFRSHHMFELICTYMYLYVQPTVRFLVLSVAIQLSLSLFASFSRLDVRNQHYRPPRTSAQRQAQGQAHEVVPVVRRRNQKKTSLTQVLGPAWSA